MNIEEKLREQIKENNNDNFKHIHQSFLKFSLKIS